MGEGPGSTRPLPHYQTCRQLDYLTMADHVHHEALAAFDVGTGSPGAGTLELTVRLGPR